jgi:FkbM family methyltransferase
MSRRAALLGSLCRSLPARRNQTAYWAGKLLAPKEPFVGTFLSGRLEVHPGEPASSSTFYQGFYERELTIWCRELIRVDPPALLVDVGANFGYYPLLFGLLTQGKTHAVAFEPEPRTLTWLSRNVALNPSLNVQVVPMVVGDVDGGSVDFAVSREGHELWSRVAEIQGDTHHHSGSVKIPTTRLDTFLDAKGVAEVPLTVIDVEGFENRVLAGMAGGLASHRYRRIVVEIHPWAFPSVSEIESMCRKVTDAGYQARRFSHFPPQDADKKRTFYDLQYDPTILGPLHFDDLSSWEHFLFEALP